MDPYTAYKRRHRVATKLKNKISKIVSSVPECEWVLVYSNLAQTKSVIKRQWDVIGNNESLVHSVQDSMVVLKKAHALDARQRIEHAKKPTNSITRASMVRSMLKKAWLEHVKGTEYEGQTQMYKLVASGKVEPFPWWTTVVGADVPFDNKTLNVAEYSSKVFDYLDLRR